MLLVIGDGVDAGKLTRKLKKEVGEADILELRTLPATGGTNALAPGSSTVVTQSAYQRHPTTPGRSVPGGGRIECPVAAAAAAARWPGEHGRQAVIGYYHRIPSPGYYHQQSPMVGLGQGGYGYAGGRSFALEVARSHPANYSPMIARHDFRAVGPPGDAGGRREHGGGGGPNRCSIL
jgi:hypothetical protein